MINIPLDQYKKKTEIKIPLDAFEKSKVKSLGSFLKSIKQKISPKVAPAETPKPKFTIVPPEEKKKPLDLGVDVGKTKTTTPAVAKEGFDIRQLVADIALRVPARAAASITLGAMEELDPSKGGRVFTPTGKMEEILFGHKESVLFKGEEVKSVQERSKEVRKFLADFGIDKGGETLSMLAVAGIVGIDLLPFGGAKKGLANALLKANKAEDVLKVLAKAKVPQDVAKLYASKFAKVTKLPGIEKGIKSLEGVLKTTKVATKIAPDLPTKSLLPGAMSPQPSVPVQKISGMQKIDINLAKQIRSNPGLTPDFVAMRTMRDGRLVSSVRESGVFATKEFETWAFRDTRGLFGNQSAVLRDVAFEMDNLTAPAMARMGGRVGPFARATDDIMRASVDQMDYVGKQNALYKKVLRDNNVKLNKKNVEKIFDVWEGKTKGFPDNIIKAGKETQELLATARTERNAVARAMGKKEMGFVDNYGPRVQEINFWRKLWADPKTTLSDNFDFVIPNAKQNPHALPRKDQLFEYKRDSQELFTGYMEAIARDIYEAPSIEQLKAIGSVFQGRGLVGGKNFIDRFIRENVIGKAAWFDQKLGFTAGTKKRALLGEINLARNIAALTGNLIFVGFTMPASLVMAVARTGPLRLARGIADFSINKATRDWAKKLPAIGHKTKGGSIGFTGMGDLDRQYGKIMKSKLETLNDYIGVLANSMEYWLTGSSAAAGKHYGKSMGLKGVDLDIFSNLFAGNTQSEYHKLARPALMNNILARASAPFSTFSFEGYRFVKTLAGVGGGIPLEKGDRIKQFLLLLAGAELYNRYTEAVTGRRLWTIGSMVPTTLLGSYVDRFTEQAKGNLGFETSGQFAGRAPGPAIAKDVENISSAIGAWVNNNNIHPLRKELTRWVMGFAKIPGATTVNRFVDGLIASTLGYQTTRTGEIAFPVQGTDQIKAMVFGVYGTDAGKTYLNRLAESRKEKDRVVPIYELAQELVAEGKEEQAQELVDGLSESEWEVYKKLKSEAGREETAQGKKDVFPLYQMIQDFLADGRRNEAQEMVDKMSDEEYHYYRLLKNQFEEYQKASQGIKPSFPEGDVYDDQGILHTISLYASAIKADPATAFDRIFTGQRIRRIDSGAIIVERMPLAKSQAVREERALGEDLMELRLDHTIPLQLGGSNNESNLELVPIDVWKMYTPLENHLGKLLRDGKISKKKAQDLIKQFKEGQIRAEDIYKYQ